MGWWKELKDFRPIFWNSSTTRDRLLKKLAEAAILHVWSERWWSAHEPGQPKELPEFWAHHQRNVQCKESKHMKSYRLHEKLHSWTSNLSGFLLPSQEPTITSHPLSFQASWQRPGKEPCLKKKSLFFFPGFLLFTINKNRRHQSPWLPTLKGLEGRSNEAAKVRGASSMAARISIQDAYRHEEIDSSF